MSTAEDRDDGDSTFHETKGKAKGFLGWMTGDRRVEAEGRAEAEVGDEPPERVVEEVEQEVKERQTETVAEPGADSTAATDR